MNLREKTNSSVVKLHGTSRVSPIYIVFFTVVGLRDAKNGIISLKSFFKAKNK